MIAEAHGIRLDVQPVQTSSLAAKSRAGGQPEYRALEDDNNIDLSAVVGVKMAMFVIRMLCSLGLVTVTFQLKNLLFLESTLR